MNYLDYFANYQSFAFEEEPLNEVDVLILNELTYLPIDQYVNQNFDVNNLTRLSSIRQAYLNRIVLQSNHRFSISTPSRITLIDQLSLSNRFKDVQLLAFENHVSIELNKQFAAATWILPNKQAVVVFRGTDDSLIGWKEDFILSYSDSIPAQIEACRYLEQVIEILPDYTITVSGHSKGGNLAVYASACQPNGLPQNIETVYSFDGPGFHSSFFDTSQYMENSNRLRIIIPQDSIVGKMLEQKSSFTIIKSRKFGLIQHMPIEWEINANQFIEVPFTTSNSQLVDSIIKTWTNLLDPKQLEDFTNQVFSFLFSLGIQSVDEVINDFWSFARQFAQARKDLNDESRQAIEVPFNLLIKISKEKIVNSRQVKAKQMKNDLHERLTNLQNTLKNKNSEDSTY